MALSSPSPGPPATRSRFRLRRNFVVDPRFQWGLILRVMLLCWLVSAIILGTTLGPLVFKLSGGTELSEATHAAAESLLYLHSKVWWLLVSCTGFALLVLLRISHRIAGPLVRVRRAMQLLSEGQIMAPFRLRDGDLLSLEAAAANEMLHRLQIRGDRSRHQIDLIRGLQARLVRGSPRDIPAVLAEMTLAVDALEVELLQRAPESSGNSE